MRRKKSRGKLGVCFCLLLCLCLTGCGGKKTYKVALLVKSTETEYWRLVHKGAEAFANHQGIELTFCGPKEESSYEEQLEIFKKCVEDGQDAVVLAAADYYLFEEPIREADIPVILVDCAVNGGVGESFVGTDNYAAGASLAQKVIEDNGTKGEIAIISFVKNTGPAIEREKGFRDVIEQESEMKMLETQYCQSDTDTACEIAREILRGHPNVSMIVGMNAQSLLGAAKAVQDEVLDREIYLGGIDCLEEEVDYIEEEIIDVCILQNPYMMGYYSVENAWKVLRGEKVEKDVWVDTYVIDRDTVFEKKSQELIFPFES